MDHAALHVGWNIVHYCTTTWTSNQRNLTKKGASLYHLQISESYLQHRHPNDLWELCITRMWADAQRDGRPAEYRWHPLVNATRFGWRPVVECHAVMLLIQENAIFGRKVNFAPGKIPLGDKSSEKCIYTVSQKIGCHHNHGYNFVNSWSICKILLLLQRAVNFQQNSY